jgi:hypothetical protein
MEPDGEFHGDGLSCLMPHGSKFVEAFLDVTKIVIVPVRLAVSFDEDIKPEVAVAMERGSPPESIPSISTGLVHE